MAAMATSTSDPGPRTVDDLENTPDDGRRYELADGRLDVSPSPKPRHGRAEQRLSWVLESSCPDGAEILPGTGVVMNTARTRYRIPDLAVFSPAGLPEDNEYSATPPVLAIEVVSPESVFRDNHTKRREYAAFGIASYWIITPSAEKTCILEFRLQDGTHEAAQVHGGDVFTTEYPFPVQMVPRWLTADGPWKELVLGMT
ncbi:Uma2 family endonuclease [Nocardiopsis coralliicola]